MFEILSSKNIYHANEIDNILNEQIKNSFPYVVRTTQNNGIRGYIIEDEKYLNDANTLSFAQDTFSVFYQKQKYFTGNKVKILKAKFENNSEKIMKYLTACFQKSLNDFTWGIGSTIETIAEIKISLPVSYPPSPLETRGERKDLLKAPILGVGGNVLSKIDFEFMEKFIAELEANRIAELEAYLLATGLKDYNLTNEEEKVLKDFNSGKFEWGEFRIEDILNWQPQKEIDPLKLEDLKDENQNLYPFYGQSTTNNGIISYNQLTRKVLNNENGKPTILIHSNNQNIIYLESPFYLKDGHGATSVLQSEKLNRINQMFLVASIDKVIKTKYSYNYKATKIELKNSIIKVLTNKKEPDYKIMEIFISAVQKLVIKDVVVYAERKIEGTRKVVGL